MNERKDQRIPRRVWTAVPVVAWGLSAFLQPIWTRAQSIGCGQTIDGSLASAGQTATYTFQANAGEVATILALGQSLNAVAEVYGPNETRVGACTNSFTGPMHLPDSGTYTIRVHSDNPSATGAYGISLTFLTGRCGTPLIWGPTAANNIASLAQVDSYTLYANAGESFAINLGSSNFTAAAFLAGPAGSILANWVNGTTTLDVTNTGTYTVGIYAFYIASAGSYTTSLAFTKLTPASYRLAIANSNGAPVVTIWGQVGRMTILQYATDMAAGQWQPLANFSLPYSPYRFVDGSSIIGSPRRFYRTQQ